MARASEVRTSFNGGELSPLVLGRIDIAKFATGCKRMRNFLPTTQGPAISRPGTRFVKEVKNSAHRSWLVRFEFTTEQAYILEFGDQYIRFYAERAVLLNAGNHYEIASPYAVADLTNADGSFALRYVQTGDVVYLFHGSYAPRKLTRTAPTSWTLAEVNFAPPPFKALNTTATTIYASAATGTAITLTASSSIFTAAHVGQYLYLEEKSVRDVKQWEAGKSITTNDIRRYQGRNYQALNTATTGGAPPTHTTGAAFDGDAGVQWQFLDPGYGWVKITAQAGTTATADVISRLPDGAVTSGKATTRWAFQAWSAADGYPTVGTFFRERLVLARGHTLWFSVAGDFENFAAEIDGEITADAGFDRVIASDRTNSIRWLSPGNVLLVGTLGDEWAIAEQTTTEAFGPSNAQTRRQSTYGANLVAPLRVGNETLFVQKSHRKVRAMQFRFEEDGFDSPDITPFAEHITSPGIVDMAFQQEPWSVLWCALSDGQLVGCTYNREQDVVAWHKHPIGVVECVEEIPSPDGTRNDLWLIVRMTVAGATKRYVCYLENEDADSTAQADLFSVDLGLTYSGSAATTISGLDHLNGHTVDVLADGAVHPQRTVSAGSITLADAATKVQVGLPLRGVLETTEVNTGARFGTVKRIARCVVMLLRTVLAKAGSSESALQEVRFRPGSTPLGEPMGSFTGKAEIVWDSDYSAEQSVVVVKDRPTPVTVVAVAPIDP